MREFGEPSTKLEFDGFDGKMTERERPKGKRTNQPSLEEVDDLNFKMKRGPSSGKAAFSADLKAYLDAHEPAHCYKVIG